MENAFKANEAYQSWKKWSHKDRAELLRVARLSVVAKKKFQLLWFMKQVSHGMKRLVIFAEGIDFIEYYARSMMDLADGKPVLDREGNITNISINQLVQALQSHLGTFHLQLWLVQL